MNNVEAGRRRGMLAVALAWAVSGCGSMKPPAPPLPLAGTLWTLQALTGMPVPAQEAGVGPTLQIEAAERRVTGSTGVNRYMGNASFDAAALSFSGIASSRRAGPLPAMAVERSLLKALDATRAYRISGTQLELLDGAGALLARFAGSAR
jgi:heat shock protein HslJ